jgi:hypothetical protein
MGRIWSVDAVAKNRSTSLYGSIVSLAESPLVEGLIYAGTDDGLIQVTEDGGQNWRRIDVVPGVPEQSYVHDLEASLHDPNTVFAVMNNFKRGDFKPYVYKSSDRGRTWTSITGDLPERGPTFSLVQDHVVEDLLFVGTEFGVFTTLDGGGAWIQLKSGMPTIPARELEIQRRENDLAVATFGRSFYILDDYTPLRELSEAMIQQDAKIFPIKDAWLYIQTSPLGGGEKASRGASLFTAPNPEFGATFTYYLKESLQTRQARRQADEKKKAQAGEDTPYPTWEELKAEDREERPVVFLTVRDVDGNVVRHVRGSTSKGMHRATWNFRYPGFSPVSANGDGGRGPLAVPGSYTVSLSRMVDGVVTEMVAPTPFEVVALGQPSLPAASRQATLEFQRQVGELQRAMMGASQVASGAADRLALIKRAVEIYPVDPGLRQEARDMELRLMDLREVLSGDPTKPRRSESGMPGLMSRVQNAMFGTLSVTTGPTESHRQSYRIAADGFTRVHGQLKQLIEVDLVDLEERLEAAGVPWTAGRRMPDWP